ncbi:MAG: hypothetical protein WCK60_00710 [Candidatus Nomurabacteria bacterium]
MIKILILLILVVLVKYIFFKRKLVDSSLFRIQLLDIFISFFLPFLGLGLLFYIFEAPKDGSILVRAIGSAAFFFLVSVVITIFLVYKFFRYIFGIKNKEKRDNEMIKNDQTITNNNLETSFFSKVEKTE